MKEELLTDKPNSHKENKPIPVTSEIKQASALPPPQAIVKEKEIIEKEVKLSKDNQMVRPPSSADHPNDRELEQAVQGLASDTIREHDEVHTETSEVANKKSTDFFVNDLIN